MEERMRLSVGLVLAAVAAVQADADQVVLTPLKDNTLIQISDGSLSQGSSEYMYVGRVGSNGGGTIRRGVIAFEIAGPIPAGSTITSAQLKLYCNLTNSGTQLIRLKRMTSDWGEGASVGFGGQGVPAEPGDATWLHRFWPDDLWTKAGGDFVSISSAQVSVGFSGWYTWGSNALVVADVQKWLDEPEANFGWLVQGNETSIKTTKQFGTKENEFAPFVPTLTIDYTPPVIRPPTPGDLDENGMVDGADLGLLLAGWGICQAVAPCVPDLNDDEMVDGADLGILLSNWTP